MLYEKAEYLIKTNKNYRKVTKEHNGHIFEMYNYVLSDYEDMKANNSFFMRGFCVVDGKIEVPGMPKFFNYGENKDWNDLPHNLKNCIVTNKFDGTLIIAFLLDGVIHFKTKMTVDSPFVDEARYIYNNIWTCSQRMKLYDALQIFDVVFFELISPAFRIVVDYEGERDLKLIAFLEKGRLVPNKANKVFDFTDLQMLLDVVSNYKNKEGVVVYNRKNHKVYKIKSPDYLEKHKAKSAINNINNLFELVLSEKIDDYISLFSKFEKNYINYFTKQMITIINNFIDEFTSLNYTQDRKTFAIENKNKKFFDFIMKIYTNKWEPFEITEQFKKYLISKFNKLEVCEKFLIENNVKLLKEFNNEH